MNNPEFKTKEQINDSKSQKETKQAQTNLEQTDVFTLQVTKEFPQLKEQISQLTPNQKIFLKKSLNIWEEDLIEDFPLTSDTLKLWINFIKKYPELRQVTKLPKDELLLYMYTKLDETIKEAAENTSLLEQMIDKIKQASTEIQSRLDANPQLNQNLQKYLSQKGISNFDAVGQNILQDLAVLNSNLEDEQKLQQQEVFTVSKILFLQLQAQKGDSKAAELLSHFETPEITAGVDSLKSLFPTLEENLADLASPTGLSDSFDQKTQEFAKYGRGIEGYKLSTISFNESARKKFFELFKEDIKKSFEHNFPDDDFENFEKWIQDPGSIQDKQKQEYYQRLFNTVVDHIQLGLQTSLNQHIRTDALKAQRDLIIEIFDFPIQTLHGPLNLASQLEFEKGGIKVQNGLKVEAKLQIDDMPLEFEITPDGEILITDFVHTPEGYQKYSAYQKGLEKLNDAFKLPSLAQLLQPQDMDISDIVIQSNSAKDLQSRLKQQAQETIQQKIKQYSLDQQKPIIEAEVNYEIKKQQTLWNLIKFYQPPYEKSLFESGQLITPENPRTARLFELQKAFDITLRERPLELQRLWLQTQRPEIQYLLKESQLAGKTGTGGDKFGTVDLLKVLGILPNDSEDWGENPTMEDVQEGLSADKLRQVADMLSKAKNNPSLLPSLPQSFKWDLNGKFPRVVRKK